MVASSSARAATVTAGRLTARGGGRTVALTFEKAARRGWHRPGPDQEGLRLHGRQGS
jgi:hypothetical protein